MFNWIDQNLQNRVVEIINVVGNTCLHTQFSEEGLSKGVTCSSFLFSTDVLVSKKQMKRRHSLSIPTVCLLIVLYISCEFWMFDLHSFFIVPQIVFS